MIRPRINALVVSSDREVSRLGGSWERLRVICWNSASIPLADTCGQVARVHSRVRQPAWNLRLKLRV